MGFDNQGWKSGCEELEELTAAFAAHGVPLPRRILLPGSAPAQSRKARSRLSVWSRPTSVSLARDADEHRRRDVGAGEVAAGEVGPGQVGPAEQRAGQVGALEVGALQLGELQVGPGQLGAAQVRALHPGGAEHGRIRPIDWLRMSGSPSTPTSRAPSRLAPLEVAGDPRAGQVGAVELGAQELRLEQAGALQARVAQIGLDRPGEVERGTVERGADQLRPVEPGPAQVGAGEVEPGQIEAVEALVGQIGRRPRPASASRASTSARVSSARSCAASEVDVVHHALRRTLGQPRPGHANGARAQAMTLGNSSRRMIGLPDRSIVACFVASKYREPSR